MQTSNELLRINRAVLLPVILALMVVVLLVSSCASGQASSSGSTSSTGSNVSASAASESSASDAASGRAERIDNSAYIGTWDLVDLEKGGVRISDNNPSAIPQMREENYLNLADDGIFYLVQGESVGQGVWTLDSPTAGTMLYGRDRVSFELVDGTLVVGTNQEIIMYFNKGDARETPPLPEGQHDLREILGN